MHDKMKLYRLHTQLNHGQEWLPYDVLAGSVEEAIAIGKKAIIKNDGITGKPRKFQGCTSSPKVVDITNIEVLSYRVWQE